MNQPLHRGKGGKEGEGERRGRGREGKGKGKEREGERREREDLFNIFRLSLVDVVHISTFDRDVLQKC
jgi:hypothetical protein